MMQLPELIERISPEEPEVYAAEQNVRRAVGNTVATDSDYMILCDTSAGGFTVSLFSATKMGRTLVVCKTSSDGNAVSVVPFGNDTIQGSESKSLTTQYDKIVITADGVSMWIVESENQI